MTRYQLNKIQFLFTYWLAAVIFYVFIEKAIETGGENAVMLEHLGDILFKKGEESEAIEIWKKALSMDAENESLIQKVETGII